MPSVMANATVGMSESVWVMSLQTLVREGRFASGSWSQSVPGGQGPALERAYKGRGGV